MIVIFPESPQTFTWGGSQSLPFIFRSFAFCMTKMLSLQVEVKSRKTKENGISHLWENGPHSSDEGNPYIKTNLHRGCFRKISKNGEHKLPPEDTFIWRLA